MKFPCNDLSLNNKWYVKRTSKNLLDEDLTVRPPLYENLLSLKCETRSFF